MSNAQDYIRINLTERSPQSDESVSRDYAEVIAREYARLKSLEDNKELLEALKDAFPYVSAHESGYEDSKLLDAIIQKHTNNNPQ